MNCTFSHPTDPALQCVRPATQRFSRAIKTFAKVHGSNQATAYAYTCDEHQQHGPDLADAYALKWAGVEGGILLDQPAPQQTSLADLRERDRERILDAS